MHQSSVEQCAGTVKTAITEDQKELCVFTALTLITVQTLSILCGSFNNKPLHLPEIRQRDAGVPIDTDLLVRV